MKKMAILFDGGFFFKRLTFHARRYFGSDFFFNASQLAKIVDEITFRHLSENSRKSSPRELYRIYFYDSPPYQGQQRLPIKPSGHITSKTMNFREHPPYILRNSLHTELKKSRKVALRMGELSKDVGWKLNHNTLKELISGNRQWADLTNDDFHLDIKQKAVDLKLGMDITTMTLNRLVDVMVLVAGDSDFVPAAKLARTHGVDFVLDPLWDSHSASLSEHVDGVRSFDLVSIISKICDQEPQTRPSWWRATQEGGVNESDLGS